MVANKADICDITAGRDLLHGDKFNSIVARDTVLVALYKAVPFVAKGVSNLAPFGEARRESIVSFFPIVSLKMWLIVGYKKTLVESWNFRVECVAKFCGFCRGKNVGLESDFGVVDVGVLTNLFCESIDPIFVEMHICAVSHVQ